MTAECRPADGAKNGTHHNLLHPDGTSRAATWSAEIWKPCGYTRYYSVEEATKDGWKYLHPITMPPRDLTREEMMEIAREALDPPENSIELDLLEALRRIARGTAE